MKEHGRGIGGEGREGGGFVDGFEEGGEGEDSREGDVGFVAVFGKEFCLGWGGAGGLGKESKAEGVVDCFVHFDVLAALLLVLVVLVLLFLSRNNGFFFFLLFLFFFPFPLFYFSTFRFHHFTNNFFCHGYGRGEGEKKGVMLYGCEVSPKLIFSKSILFHFIYLKGIHKVNLQTIIYM